MTTVDGQNVTRHIGMLYLFFSGLSVGMIFWPGHSDWFRMFLPFQAFALGYLGYRKITRSFL